MYAEFKGRKCKIYSNTKQFVRQFNVGNDIVNVQVSGESNNAVVAITMKNGKTILYKATGQLIRR